MESNLSNFLQRYLENFKSQKDMAAKLGLDASHLNHIIAGKRTDLSVETVGKMVAALSHDAEAQAHVLCAYLWDRVPKDYKGLVTIDRKGVGKRGTIEPAATYGDNPVSRLSQILRQPYVSPKLAETLEKLAIVANDSPELRSVLEGLTKLDIGPKK